MENSTGFGVIDILSGGVFGGSNGVHCMRLLSRHIFEVSLQKGTRCHNYVSYCLLLFLCAMLVIYVSQLPRGVMLDRRTSQLIVC